MPTVEARCVVGVPPEVAFAVSQTTGQTRLRWDPFIRRQWFSDGSTHPGKGVQTTTQHRLGPKMVSEYVSYAPPRNVGMKMVRGPWFFETFAGGWQFRPVDDDPGMCEAIWRYSFSITPVRLRPLADPIGTFILGRDIRRRIAGFAAGCQDPVVLAAVSATAE